MATLSLSGHVFCIGLGRISVLTDIRYLFFFTDIRYPFFTTIRPDIRRIVRFLSRNNKKNRDKTLIKLVIDDKMFNFLNFTISDFQDKKNFIFFRFDFLDFFRRFFFQ